MPSEQPPGQFDASGGSEQDPLVRWLALMKESAAAPEQIQHFREELSDLIEKFRAIQQRMNKCERGEPEPDDNIIRVIDDINENRRLRDAVAAKLWKELARMEGRENEIEILSLIMHSRDTGREG